MRKIPKWVMGLVALLAVLAGMYVFMQPKSLVMEIKNESDYQEVLAEEVAYVYFGRDTCKYCRAFEPLMNQAIRETGATVYKYDTDDHQNDGDFQTILDVNEVTTVPKLVRLEKGVRNGFVDHTHTQEQITAFLTEE